jgi:hypothetical protein
MTTETFRTYGTQLEGYRQTCKKQDARIKELLGANAVLARECADVKERLQNLRDARRREKRAELEKELILPGDPRGFDLSNKR